MRTISLICLLLLGCNQGLKDRSLTRSLMQEETTQSDITAELSAEEQEWLYSYLARAEEETALFDGVTVGEALQRQRQHEQALQMQGLEDAQPRSQVPVPDENLRAIVNVEVRDKAFVDGSNRLTLVISNHSSSVVSSAHGILQPVTGEGYRFPEIEVVHSQPLAPDTEYVQVQVLNLNLAERVTMQNTALWRIQFIWIPQRIVMEDGTVLEPLSP